jgi:peptide/nickel transport system substrate-binding protein
MVKLGEADIAPSIAAQDATDPQLDHSFLNSETSFLRIDTTIAPLNDKRVRLALNYAFDRDSIRGSIVTKDNIDATQMVMPSIPGHNFELDKQVRHYDPAKAKQLLAEAKASGVPVDAEILLLGRPAGYPEAVEVMEAALTTYRAVGFNMKLKQLEPGEYAKWNNKPFPEGRGPSILQNSHDNSFGDPMFSLPYRYFCSDGNNSPMCDPKLDADINKIAQMSGDERYKGFQEIFKRMYDDYVAEVWGFHMVGYARVGSRVNFVPDVSTNNELRGEDVTFK